MYPLPIRTKPYIWIRPGIRLGTSRQMYPDPDLSQFYTVSQEGRSSRPIYWVPRGMRHAAVASAVLTLVAARPELRAGYDCTTGCGGQACTAASFRLELLDALQWHPGLEVRDMPTSAIVPPAAPRPCRVWTACVRSIGALSSDVPMTPVSSLFMLENGPPLSGTRQRQHELEAGETARQHRRELRPDQVHQHIGADGRGAAQRGSEHPVAARTGGKHPGVQQLERGVPAALEQAQAAGGGGVGVRHGQGRRVRRGEPRL